MQEFRVDKVTFKGEWAMATHEINIKLKEMIGSGGMRVCHAAEISKFPPTFAVQAPAGWVAKLYKSAVPGDTYSLCRKVDV